MTVVQNNTPESCGVLKMPVFKLPDQIKFYNINPYRNFFDGGQIILASILLSLSLSLSLSLHFYTYIVLFVFCRRQAVASEVLRSHIAWRLKKLLKLKTARSDENPRHESNSQVFITRGDMPKKFYFLKKLGRVPLYKVCVVFSRLFSVSSGRDDRIWFCTLVNSRLLLAP